MRIALYHPRAAVGDGGITRSVRNLAKGFTDLGVAVRVIHDGDSAPDEAAGEWVGVQHVGRGQLRLPANLSNVLGELDAIVLHSAWTGHNAYVGWQAEQAGVPVILAPRGAYDPQIVARHSYAKRAWWVAFERSLVARATAIHVFFDSQIGHLAALGYAGRSIIAPNGVEVPEPGSWDGGSSGRVVFLGRFDPEHKGLDLLVDAMALLKPEVRPYLSLHGPDWRGGKVRIAKRVARLRLESWIELADPVYGDEKWDILRSAAAFVYPSRWEAFGNSLAEAGAIGVPSLATQYPLATYLASRGAAVSVPSTASSIAQGLLEVVGQGAARFGRNAAAELSEFSWSRVSQLWMEQVGEAVA